MTFLQIAEKCEIFNGKKQPAHGKIMCIDKVIIIII